MKEHTEKELVRIILDQKESKESRIQAGFKLENAVDDNSIRQLGKALLTDPSPIVRHEFAFSLGETAHPKIAIPYLIKAVEEDENIFVRHEAMLALSTLGYSNVKSFIQKFLNAPEPEIAESAEIALQRIEQTGN